MKLLKLSLPRIKIKKTISALTSLLIVLAIGCVLIILRHQQLCSYQQFVNNGQLISSTDVNICPNIFEPSELLNVITNAFNFNILEALTVNNEVQPNFNPPECTNQLDPLCWLAGTTPSLKQTDNRTNLLLVGIDSRGKRNNLQNTDSLMVASLDNSTGEVLLISFPRDLYVKYKRINGYTVNYKINGVYAIDGINGLRYTIEQILGKPIHYHAVLNFDVFVKFVDQLGGVDITLDTAFKDLYPCIEVPAGHSCPKSFLNGYGLFTFTQGKHHFSSFEALIYTRARQLSSDFDRASRQQKFLKAVLKSVLENSDPVTVKVEKYFKLYNLLNKEIVTDVQIKDVAAVLSLLEKIGDNPARIVADPSLGGANKIIYSKGIIPGAGYSIVFRDNSYQQFQNYIKNIWNYLPYYVERPKILVYTDPKADQSQIELIKKVTTANNPFWEIKYKQQELNLKGIRIYNLHSGESSARDLQTKIKTSLIYNTQIDQIENTNWGENILIYIGSSN